MMALQPDLVRLDAWPKEQTLPGVIGADPREVATAEFGNRILENSVNRATRLLDILSAGDQREVWFATLRAVVDVLERTRTLRFSMPRDLVPPITTPDYLAACSAIAAGEFASAQNLLHQKLASLQHLGMSNQQA